MRLTQVTGYLDRLNLLEARMREVSGDAMSRTEANTAAESLRKLYADLFEETHALRERMWELGTFLFLHRTRDVCNAQAAGSPVVGAAAQGYGASAACTPRIEYSTPTHGIASLARDAADSTPVSYTHLRAHET